MWTEKRVFAQALLVVSFILILGAAVSACGSGGGGTSESEGSTTSNTAANDIQDTHFTVGKFTAPNILVAGEALGRYDNLSVSFTELTGGPEALPLLTSGDLAGASDVSEPPVAIGLARGIKMKIVWEGNSVPVTLLVNESIKGPEELKGKTFGDSAGSIMQLKLFQYLEENGLDRNDINFVDIGAPEVVAAFKSNAIDGTNMFPPYTKAIEAQGARKLTESDAGNVLLMSEQFINEHADVVQAFVCDLAGVQADAIKDPKTTDDAIANYLEMDPAEVPGMLPTDAIVPLQEMTGPKYLGHSGAFAKNVVEAGKYLSELGELDSAPSLDQVNAAIDLQFIEAAQEGKCSR